ncbi:MAG: hypothetical protein AVDCRST_MAG73-45, partial [uncultured Thermomicrobiales bacterium]
ETGAARGHDAGGNVGGAARVVGGGWLRRRRTLWRVAGDAPRRGAGGVRGLAGAGGQPDRQFRPGGRGLGEAGGGRGGDGGAAAVGGGPGRGRGAGGAAVRSAGEFAGPLAVQDRGGAGAGVVRPRVAGAGAGGGGGEGAAVSGAAEPLRGVPGQPAGAGGGPRRGSRGRGRDHGRLLPHEHRGGGYRGQHPGRRAARRLRPRRRQQPPPTRARAPGFWAGLRRPESHRLRRLAGDRVPGGRRENGGAAGEHGAAAGVVGRGV